MSVHVAVLRPPKKEFKKNDSKKITKLIQAMNHCGRQQQLTYFSNTSNWTSFFNYNSNIVQANRSPKTPKKKKRQFDEFAKEKKK